MKNTLVFFLSLATSSLASPTRHRNGDVSVNDYKGAGSRLTNADEEAGGCPCGTAMSEAGLCVPFTCPTTPICDATCSNTAELDALMLAATGDKHHIKRQKKTCRFNNDASCHKCASTSCQYRYGNYWGTGAPCIGQEIKGAETGYYLPVDYETGMGLTITIGNQYGQDPQQITFCNTDQYEMDQLDCGMNRYPAIVLPKSCTHCQTARCVDPRQFPRYDHWNNFQYLELTAYNDGKTWLYQCASYDADTGSFTQVLGYLPNEDESVEGVLLYTEDDLLQDGAVTVGRDTLSCYQAGAATWQTLYFSYIGPDYFRNVHHVAKMSDLVDETFEDNYDLPYDFLEE